MVKEIEMMLIRGRKYPFYLGITTLVVIIVLVVTGLFLWISYKESRTAALNAADQLFNEINEKVGDRYRHGLASVSVLAGSMVLMPGMDNVPLDDGLSFPGLNVMLKALEYYEYIQSLYAGYDNGNFIQVIGARRKPDIQVLYKAPPGTFFIVRSIAQEHEGTGTQYWLFFDRNRSIIGKRLENEPAYDPRNRPWYLKAIDSDHAVYSDPYVFSFTKRPGITCSERFPEKGGVFGIDITLERFSQSLKKQKVSPHSTLFFFDRQGHVIVHSEKDMVKTIVNTKNGEESEEVRFKKGEDFHDPLVRTVMTSHEKGRIPLGKTELIMITGKEYLVNLSGLGESLGFNQLLATAAPLSDFTGHIQNMQYRTTLFSLIVLMVVLPVVLLMVRRFSGSLMLLEREARKVRRFDFSESAPFDSIIKEIHSLIQAFGLMKSTIAQRTEALIATQKKLENLVKSGLALAAEHDMDSLLKMIFGTARELAYADGGTLYLRDKEGKLQFEIMQTASEETMAKSAVEEGGLMKTVPLYDEESGHEIHRYVESHVALTGETIIVDDIAKDNNFDFSQTCTLAEKSGKECISFLTVPLNTRQGATIGVLQLFNARDVKTRKISTFEEEIVGFVEALAAQAAVALHNKRLLEEQRNLFNAFLELIAGAIDAKSPYTGAHCARVPEAAMMLAKVASESKDEPFADFKLSTDDEWREFRVAAWLHDCGKVTTPEYVVDKATKLETIYNRIHEIRTRFEVLWRDAEITHYRGMLDGQEDAAELKEKMNRTFNQLREDFAFVAECNIGGEFMADEKIRRLEAIGEQKWVRHFDDRLGLSQEELNLKACERETVLPVEENLITDREEHIIPRSGADPFEGNPYGFKMKVPEYLYNRGELYNLCIRKGTLSEEERFKINEHIVQTIMMLEKLPFPSSMEHVGEFAGAHHETMNGTGYPRRLTKEEMSLAARIMAIADIFEALTATDRPYKKAKTLSESLRIMSFMRDEYHIDGQLFELFLRSGVYKKYADQFLEPHQIDEVDIHSYL
jgi:HD-GYP domain-containing protein (c-di-GMP phosphodiesterase class II)